MISGMTTRPRLIQRRRSSTALRCRLPAELRHSSPCPRAEDQPSHEQTLFLTRVHDRLFRTGLADLADPDQPTTLRTATRAYGKAGTTTSDAPGLAT